MNSGDSKIVFDHPDFEVHKIWHCEFSNDPEIDYVFVPAIGENEITQAVCGRGAPCIPLLVEDTQLRCLGYYDVKKDTIYSVALWMVEEWRGFSYIDAPKVPVVLVSQVPIFGVLGRRFLQRAEKDRYTEKMPVT